MPLFNLVEIRLSKIFSVLTVTVSVTVSLYQFTWPWEEKVEVMLT